MAEAWGHLEGEGKVIKEHVQNIETSVR